MDSLYLNSTGLTGTQVRAIVLEDTAGSTLGGTYRLYAGGEYRSGLPLSSDQVYVDSIGTGDSNGTGRSAPLVWNAEAIDVQAAINALLPEYSAEGSL